jgi:hypothetical protein
MIFCWKFLKGPPLFPQVLEASIIISVMLNALHKVGAQNKKKYVWWGAGLGIFISLILSIAFVAVFYAASSNIFAGSRSVAMTMGCSEKKNVSRLSSNRVCRTSVILHQTCFSTP